MSAHGIDMSAHVERIREEGYSILEGALPPESGARIRAELAPWLSGERPGRNDFEGFRTERVYAMLAKSPATAELVEHPHILPIADALLQPNYLLSALLAINIHPGETPQPWHIDDAAGSLGHPSFARPRAPLGLSAIWALDDFTSTNGATEIVPGSQRWPEGREPVEGECVQALMPAGAVLVFAGNLIHRGGANRSDTARLAITSQYCMPWLRQIENMPLAVPPAVARQYSERVQSLLGYNVVEPGFMGYVDGRHPRLLVDPAYRGRRHRV
jgi:ectoine hydroxylase-related dioxygenase (phytanoyl-CoA dioxygenase family)